MFSTSIGILVIKIKKVSWLSYLYKGIPKPRKMIYPKTSNISRILVGNKIVDNSDKVGASPVGAAPTTVETPYNTAPYITGSNIARLGHGSQNSWSKLWIPIVKSAPVRVIFTWKSVPKKSIHGSSDTMEAVARLPVVLPFRCDCHLPLLWHNRHYMTPWSSIHGQEGLITWTPDILP